MYLVGAGVVGRAILRAHTDAGVSACVADIDKASVVEAVESLNLDPERWTVSNPVQLGQQLPAIEITSKSSPGGQSRPIVIESIAERLDAKQEFFASAESLFGEDAVLCSNTSTLQIGKIAEALVRPERMCGHAFLHAGLQSRRGRGDSRHTDR